MKIRLLFCILLTSWAQSQITVNSSSFASVGDTVRVSVAQLGALDYSSTGPNYTWDFTALVLDSQRVTDYRPVSETNAFFIQPYFGSFADAAHQASYYTKMTNFTMAPDSALGGLSVNNAAQYTKIDATAFNLVGFSAELSGFPIAVPSDTIETVYSFPMNFQDSWNSTGYSAIDISLVNIAFKQFRKRSSTVDGWGSISTPYGTFDVLRVKHVIFETDSVKIEIDTAMGPQWFGFDIPERHDYEWIAANEKEPILRITTTVFAGFETVSAVSYRDIYRPKQQSGLAEMSENELQLYPNPSEGVIHVSQKNELSAFEIRSIEGKVLRTGKLSGKSFDLDVQDLPGGYYNLQLSGNGGNLNKSFYKL